MDKGTDVRDGRMGKENERECRNVSGAEQSVYFLDMKMLLLAKSQAHVVLDCYCAHSAS